MSQSQHHDKGRKKRVRNWTADDRAVHRVFERSRREAFKDSLLNLAALVPSLQSADPSKLSKHVVLGEATTLLQSTTQRVAESQMIIDSLLAERRQLLSEINVWRASAGMELESCAFPTAVAPVGAGLQMGMEAPAAGTVADTAGGLSPLPLDRLPESDMEVFGGANPAFASVVGELSHGVELVGFGDVAHGPAPWQPPDLSVSVDGMPNYNLDACLLA